MSLTYDQWHDGESYNLESLRQLSPKDQLTAERALLAHTPQDWRDIEALAQLPTRTAKAAVIAALKSEDPAIRRTAQQYAQTQLPDPARTRQIVKSLKTAAAYKGLPQLLMEVQDHHPAEVLEALLKGTLEREGEVATHYAAMLYYLKGLAKEPFDWTHRPFFLRFNTENKQDRQLAFIDLCQHLNINPAHYL
jgi:hypothetical protein